MKQAVAYNTTAMFLSACRYEAHTARPGSVKLVVSAVVPPEEVFLPLLGAAAAQGINPNLGKSESKLNVQQLLQVGGQISCGVGEVH